MNHTKMLRHCAISVAVALALGTAQAKTPDEAESMYAELKPDVMVLDIRFGTELTGLDAARGSLAQFPAARIVFLRIRDENLGQPFGGCFIAGKQ